MLLLAVVFNLLTVQMRPVLLGISKLLLQSLLLLLNLIGCDGGGKIGGVMRPSTILDAGYTEDTPLSARRLPPTDTYLWRILSRAFTTGQSRSTIRATTRIDVLDNDSLEAACLRGEAFQVTFRGFPDTSPVTLLMLTPELAKALIVVIPHNICLVDVSGEAELLDGVAAPVNLGVLGPAYETLSSPEVRLDAAALPSLADLPAEDVVVQVTAALDVPSATRFGGIVMTARRDKGTVLVRAHYMASAEAFEAMLARPGSDLGRQPACLMLDVRMPGLSGLALFDRLLERGLVDRLPVIFLTGHADVPTAVDAVKRGAFDFCEKPFSDNALVDRIEQAIAQSARTLDARRHSSQLQTRLQELTERERDVMRLVVEGLPNKLIADQLDISVRTVEVHRARVFDKMEVKSAVELANLMRDL